MKAKVDMKAMKDDMSSDFSPHGSRMASADHLVRAWHETYGLPTLITNCSNNYGPYQFPEKLIPLMILNALEGKDLPIYGDGGNIRDWLFVTDHCDAILAVLEKGVVGEKYNVGGNSERTNLQVVDDLCAALHSSAELGHLRAVEQGCVQALAGDIRPQLFIEVKTVLELNV